MARQYQWPGSTMGRESPDDPYEDLARWLRESGQRAHLAANDRQPLPLSPQRSPAAGNARTLTLFGLLTLSFLQYYFLDVLSQIYALHAVVVFLPVAPLSGTG